MSKKKAPKDAFHSPASGSFTQKKKVIFRNIKHSGDERNISLKSGSGYSAFSNVESLSGDENDVNMSGGSNGSLLGSAVNTPRAIRLSTDMDFGSLFSSPNFAMNKEVKPLPSPIKKASFNSKWVDSVIIKTQVEVPVKKSFALDINLSAVEGKSESMRKAASLAEKEGIIVNNDVRKQGLHSDWAVVIKEIPMNTPKDMIITAVSEFGIIKSIKIQLVVCVAMAMRNCNTWASRDHFRVLLFTLSVGMTAHDLGTLLDEAGDRTCIINCSLNTGNRFCCAVVGFESEKDLDSAFHTEPIFGGVCGHFGHLALECDVPANNMPSSFLAKSSKDFLAKLYQKKNVLISCPVVFGGKFWAQVVSVATSLSRGLFAGSGLGSLPFSHYDFGDVFSLNDRLASLECSLELFFDWVSTIVRRLAGIKLVPLVSSSLTSPFDTSASSALSLDSDMVLDGALMLFALHFSSAAIVGEPNLGSSSSKVLTGKVGGLESKLASLEASIGSVLACLDDMCFGSGAPLPFLSQ
ncbi:hypothetical protein G9A89_017781 [Geosiphon pyriformis]|nr:hypothetical protein G9A89_017781 [Geosiphon pyriformis]